MEKLIKGFQGWNPLDISKGTSEFLFLFPYALNAVHMNVLIYHIPAGLTGAYECLCNSSDHYEQLFESYFQLEITLQPGISGSG